MHAHGHGLITRAGYSFAMVWASSGGVGGEGWQPPTMMIKKIMFQLGQKIREVAGGLGGPMVIEQVMIQLGVNNLKSSGGVGGGRQAPHDDRKTDDSTRGKKSK